MNTHTPAPWQYDETTYSVWANEGDKKIVRLIPLDDEERANARLIAAAPELLEALKIAKCYMEGDADDEQEQRDYALILEAIAAAE